MALTTKALAIFWSLVAGILVLVPSLYLPMHGIIKLLFEGNSYGKLMAFLLWEIFFFITLTILPKPHFNRKLNPIIGLLALVIIGLSFGIALQLGINSALGVSQNGYLGVLTEFNGITTWEASHLGHIHIGKSAIAPFAQMGLIGSTTDNGLPMFETLPGAQFIAIIYISLIVFIFIFAFLEVKEKKPMLHETLLLSIATFACMVAVLDGGAFTQVGKIAIGLLALYLATVYTKGNLKFINQIIYPLGAVLLTQTIFELFANYKTLWSTEAYVVLAVSLIVIAYETFKIILRKRNSVEYGKLIISLILLYFVWGHLSTYLNTYSIGSYPSRGDEVSLFVYGLPKTATNAEIIATLGGYGDVTNFERWSWTARVNMTITHPCATNIMAGQIRTKLNSDSYLYIVRLWEKQTIWVIDPLNTNRLNNFKSKFVTLTKISSKNGKTKYGFKTRMDPVWTNLYLLDYLQSKGEHVPIALVTDWFE